MSAPEPSPLPPPPPRRDIGADTVVPDAADTVVPDGVRAGAAAAVRSGNRDGMAADQTSAAVLPPPRAHLKRSPPMTRLIALPPPDAITRVAPGATRPVQPPSPTASGVQTPTAAEIPPTLAEFDGTVARATAAPQMSDPFARASVADATARRSASPIDGPSMPSGAGRSVKTAEHVFVPDQRRLDAIAATYPGWPNHEAARLVGVSSLMSVLFDKAQALADRLYANPDDAGVMSSETMLLEPGPPLVLIDGAFGTGRRQLARALLALGPNRDGPVVHVDCAADSVGRETGLLRAPAPVDRRRHRPPDRDHVSLFGVSPNVRDRARAATFSAMAPHGPHGGLAALLATAAGGLIVFANADRLSLGAQRQLVGYLEPAAYPRRAGDPRMGLAARSVLHAPDGTPLRVWPHPAHLLVVLTACGTFQEHLAAGSIEPRLWQLATAYQRHLTLPRLWERKQDLGPLVDCFTRQAALRFGLPHRKPADGTAKALARFEWPENVTQLQRACELAVLQSLSETLQPEDFLDL